MDEARNPFAPGAGNPPPELAGRHEILRKAEVVLDRTLAGRHAKSFMLVGLRGVGKTVLLNRIGQLAEVRKLRWHLIESPEDKPLPDLLVPALRRLLIGMRPFVRTAALVTRGLNALASFAKSFKVKYEGVEVGVEVEKGVADSGDLESDLADLVVAIGEAAKAAGTGVLLLIDEVQYVSELELSAIIMAIHRANQRELPFVLIAAGLPQLVAKMGRSKSYAERLFDFPEVGPLSRADAITAIVEPIAKEGEHIVKAAANEIVDRTEGYPFFLQVWGYHCWNEAKDSPIKTRDVLRAEPAIIRALDESFFRVRFDRLTPSEKRYLRAMAELGPGPHRSGEVSEALGIKVQSAAPVRNGLIQKGMIYSPAHGDTAYTVPQFDRFLKRQMPGGDW
ncbi:MAG: ATP-binding protein [Hyphomicrobiaceae bacterium]|nr:MAG: ATP-binding protein [Hyphomicrobiaceae bacterium]